MPEFLHLQKIGKKLQSTAWSSQILQHLEQFLKNWFLHSKLSNSTSTPALLFYKSTTFFSPNSTFYNFFLWKFYIYKHPKFLQFYNIFLAIFYILQWFFGPNLQSTFTPPSPLQVCPFVCPLSPHATIWFMVFIHNISLELFSKNFITKV